MIIATDRTWKGGCVYRIRDALANLVEAAERNLIVAGRKDCDAVQYGFPRDLMAGDFRDKALKLDGELLSPGSISPELRPTAEYPASDNLPVGIRGALDWLAKAFSQQMHYWGWVDDDDEPGHPLIYQISEHDLGRLSRCLTRLDEEILRHPGPPRQRPKSPSAPAGDARDKGRHEACGTDDWRYFLGALEQLQADEPPPPPPKGPQLVHVLRLDGSTSTFDPRKATRWTGQSDFDFGAELSFRVDLCRSQSGRWMTCTTHSRPGPTFLPSGPVPGDLWEEITLEQAAEWFISTWRPTSDEEGQSMPCEIREKIARTDIDGPMEKTPQPAQEEADEIGRDRPDRAPTAVNGLKDPGKKWRVIASYHARLAKKESISLRAIADEAGCDPSYVSKVLKPLRSDRRDSAPRGWKDSEGGMDAIA